MAKPLPSSLRPSSSSQHFQASLAQDRRPALNTTSLSPPFRTPSNSHNTPQSRVRHRAAPSTTVLALLATLVAEQARAEVPLSPTPTREIGWTAHRDEEPGCTPDVPDFLCPSLVVSSVTTPPPTASAALESFDCSSIDEEQQPEERINEYPNEEEDEDDATAFTSSSSLGREDPYLLRSASSPSSSTDSPLFFTVSNPAHFYTHDYPRFLQAQDVVDNDVYIQRDVGASASKQYNGRSASNFSPLPSRGINDEPKHKNKKKSSGPRSSKLRRGFRRADSSTSTTTECSELYTSRTIPDRYELGNDGRWHKLSVWSSCSLCSCASHEVDDAANNDISPTGVSNDSVDAAGVSSVSATPSSTSDTFSVVLPDGWDRTSSSAIYRVPLIVICSLLLAAAVTCAVWLSFFWRRRQRRVRQLAFAKDLEKRRKAEGYDSGSGYEDDDNVDGVRGGRMQRSEDGVYADECRREKTSADKAKARWARAAAQWKAHVRWIHRRRRGRTGRIDGVKQHQHQQREDATASGVSLSRSSMSSSRSGARRSVGDRSGGAGESASQLDAEGRSTRTVNVTESQSELERGSRFRVRGTASRQERRREREITDEGALTDVDWERRPSIEVQFDNQTDARNDSERGSVQEPNYQQEQRYRGVGLGDNSGNSGALSNLHSSSSAVSVQVPASTADAAAVAMSVPVADAESWARREYDHPPPETHLEGEVAQDPPAYRSRHSRDSAPRVRNSRRRRRDDKRAEAIGYVPASEDCAPYSSSDESDREGRSSMDSRRASGDEQHNMQMHVAVDDKQALARLAAYASAPPVPSSPSPPPLLSRSSSTRPPHLSPASTGNPSSHPSTSYVLAEPNAPPEPEWERFDDYDYTRALGLTGADEADSPGAGPGPSTTYARSIAPGSRSGSPCPASRASSPSYSAPSVYPSFPAPPAPISSQLVYAPADAGLSIDHSSQFSSHLAFSFDNFGFGPEDFDVRAIEGPSAPPFTPYDMQDLPVGEDVLIGASAPPLFAEEEDDLYVNGEGIGPSVPSEVDLADVDVGVDGEPESDGESESRRTRNDDDVGGVDQREEEAVRESLPDTNAHVETADRNTVPSAVR